MRFSFNPMLNSTAQVRLEIGIKGVADHLLASFIKWWLFFARSLSHSRRRTRFGGLLEDSSRYQQILIGMRNRIECQDPAKHVECLALFSRLIKVECLLIKIRKTHNRTISGKAKPHFFDHDANSVSSKYGKLVASLFSNLG